MAKISKQMDLVSELNDAKLAKCKVEAQADKEKFMTEVKILEDTIKVCHFSSFCIYIYISVFNNPPSAGGFSSYSVIIHK